VSAGQRRRLEAIELAVAGLRDAASSVGTKSVDEMTDSEAVLEWYRLCHMPMPRPVPPLRPLSREEEEQILAEWWRLKAERAGP
jgi:hypothetical protein